MMVRSLSFAAFSAALVLSLAVSGCSSWDELGQEKKTPLAGSRKALFPQGIPGVEFGAPPQQPSNSNIAINPGTNTPTDPNAQQAEQDQAKQGQKQKQPVQMATGSRMQVRGQKAHADEQARAAKLREQENRTATQEEKAARTASRSKKNAESEDPWSEAR